MLHINNLFLYENVVIDKTFNGRVDGDEEGRRLAGAASTLLPSDSIKPQGCPLMSCSFQCSLVHAITSSIFHMPLAMTLTLGPQRVLPTCTFHQPAAPRKG